MSKENENSMQIGKPPGKIKRNFDRVRNFSRWMYRNFWKVSIILLLIILTKYREIAHPYLYASREYWAMILLTILIVFSIGFILVRKFKKSSSPFFRIIVFLMGCGIIFASVKFRADKKLLQTYESVEKLKAVSTSIPTVNITKPPITFHDRVYPLYLAKQDIEKEGAIGSSRELSMPCQVMLNDANSYWGIMITPNRWYQQLYCNVEEVQFINVTSIDLKPLPEHVIEVSFDIAPNLLGSKDIVTSTIRSFTPSMYFNYKPGQPRPMLNDEGEVVQIVPLSKLESMPGITGKAYAYPVFGGVMIFEQNHIPFFSSPVGWFKRWLKRVFLGDGIFMSPEEIETGKHKYLLNQTLRPYEQMVYESKSYRYNKGLFGTIVHENDVVLEDPGEGRNPMPYINECDYRGTGADYLGRKLTMYTHMVTHGDNNAIIYTLYKTADGLNDTLYILDRVATGYPKYGLKRAATKIFDTDKALESEGLDALEHLDLVRDVLTEEGDTIRKEYYYSTVVKTDKTDSTEHNVSIPDKTLSEGSTGIVTWIKTGHINDWEKAIPGVITYDDDLTYDLDVNHDTLGNAAITAKDDTLVQVIPTVLSAQDSLDQILAVKQQMVDSILSAQKEEKELEKRLSKERELDSILNSVKKPSEKKITEESILDSVKEKLLITLPGDSLQVESKDTIK